MLMEVHLPGPLLRPYVRSYTVIESQEAVINRVLPDTGMVMAIRYKGSIATGNVPDHLTSLRPFVLSGIRKTRRHIQYAPNTGNVLVTFKDGAASAFFREPLHELYDDTISLPDLIGFNTMASLEDHLFAASDHAARIVIIENLLFSRLINPEHDTLVQAGLQAIRKSGGMAGIRELSSILYVSQDAFEKRFRRSVGVSPKQYASIIRMQRVLKYDLQQHSLTSIAHEAGFYDQAHFIKDFRRFTGQTPTDFFKSPLYW